LLLLAPVFGVATGVFILGEVLSWRFGVGAVVTLAGIVAIMTVHSRKKPA